MSGVHPPEPVVPVPASLFTRLRGRRVIVGVPGVGFRGDLRADDAVGHAGGTFVPVLTEQDYYRAEMERVEAVALLVPIHRVWVEQVGGEPPAGAGQPLHAPPPVPPIAAVGAGRISGRRLVRAVPDGHVRDLRAVTEVYVGTSGEPCVRVCDETEWYVWGVAGRVPAATEVAAVLLWVE